MKVGVDVGEAGEAPEGVETAAVGKVSAVIGVQV